MATLLTLRLPPNTLLGIDLLSLNTSKQFHGISGIPSGWHFVFTGVTASLSIRHGFWFHVPLHGLLLVKTWDIEKEELVTIEDAQELEEWRRRLIAEAEWATENLIPFRQSVATTVPRNTAATEDGLRSSHDSYFPALVRHISASLLSRITSATFTLLSTSCGAQDREHIPGLTAAEVATTLGTEKEAELVFLGIELQRTWREGAVGRERTEGARDRSWALSEVVRQSQIKLGGRGKESTIDWGNEVLGEMEFCFLMTALLSNFSCLEEWKRILELVLTCQSIISEQEKFFCEFIRLLGRQLKRCEDVEGGLFDFTDDTYGRGAGTGGGFLRSLLQKFKRTLDETFSATDGEDIKREMKTLEDWLNKKLGWELGDNFVRRGMLELEDGEQIEIEIGEMEGEDERGEFAPVVLDLGEQVV